jgi:hypothetical protein
LHTDKRVPYARAKGGTTTDGGATPGGRAWLPHAATCVDSSAASAGGGTHPPRSAPAIEGLVGFGSCRHPGGGGGGVDRDSVGRCFFAAYGVVCITRNCLGRLYAANCCAAISGATMASIAATQPRRAARSRMALMPRDSQRGWPLRGCRHWPPCRSVPNQHGPGRRISERQPPWQEMPRCAAAAIAEALRMRRALWAG